MHQFIPIFKDLFSLENVEIVTGSSANSIFIQIARLLLEKGEKVSPRGLSTIEITDLWINLLNPKEAVVTLPERNISHQYLKGEHQWFLSGSREVQDIVRFSSFWNIVANNDGTVNSNYGYYTFHQLCPNGKSQFDWCVEKIQHDPETRQAIINYNQPMHKYDNNKDFVCTISQLFRQHNGSIDTTVLMRSNDFIYGLTYNLPWFAFVLLELCKKTGYNCGIYKHYAASLHVYDRHLEMLHAIANAEMK